MSAPVLNLQTMTRSKERVRDAAEVYTNFREVDAMLDLLPSGVAWEPMTLLEPAFGNGQFLVVVMQKKAEEIMRSAAPDDFAMRFLRSIALVSGVEILPDSREECVQRLMRHARGWHVLAAEHEPDPGWFLCLRQVLELKLVLGNFLAGVTYRDITVLDDLTILVKEHRDEGQADYIRDREKRRQKGPIFEDEAEASWPAPISKEQYLAAGVIFVDDWDDLMGPDAPPLEDVLRRDAEACPLPLTRAGMVVRAPAPNGAPACDLVR